MVATLGKLGRDLSLLMQTEVAEVSEPAAPGRGASSTMPHKRNPVGCAIAIAAATRAPGLVATMLAASVQEHERGLGNWPAEWDTLPDLFELAAGSLAAMIEVIEGLEVDVDRMRTNLEATRGLLYAERVQMALAPALGRGAAHTLLAAACQRAVERKQHLREVLAATPEVMAVLSHEALNPLFEPNAALGASNALIARVLDRYDRSIRDSDAPASCESDTQSARSSAA
jgi:3-carboxy-cis,cis-muconate cycloisomerase